MVERILTSAVSESISPSQSGTYSASSLVATKYFERVRQRLVKVLQVRERGLLAEQVARLRPHTDRGWRPEVGMIAAFIQRDPGLAALQCVLASHPTEVELCAEITAPALLFVDGYLVHVNGFTKLALNNNELTIASGEDLTELHYLAGRWQLKRQQGTRRVHGLEIDGPRYIVESGISGQLGLFPDPLMERSTTCTGALEFVHALEIASTWLTTGSPTYRRWLSSAIDSIILVSNDASVRLSSPEFPGLIALYNGLSPLEYVDLLISGCCHQKLFQLALLSPLTEIGIEEVHYVPLRRTYVTARRALAAAHEHVNVLLALNQLRDVVDAPRELLSKIERRTILLETDCVPILDRSEALTSNGNELWESLKHLAFENGLKSEGAVAGCPDTGHKSAIPQIRVAGLAT